MGRSGDQEAEERVVMMHEGGGVRVSQEERERIDKVACFVAVEGGDLAEALLLRLLKITKNHRRWGFLSPDHSHHAYYLRRKISEQCRAIRPPRS